MTLESDHHVHPIAHIEMDYPNHLTCCHDPHVFYSLHLLLGSNIHNKQFDYLFQPILLYNTNTKQSKNFINHTIRFQSGVMAISNS
jgi:hypothetical protein